MTFDWVAAIHDRAVVTFTYDGLPRVVQPATVGTSTAGRAAVRACLIDGLSRRNSIPCWELYSIDKIIAPRRYGSMFVSFALSGYTKQDSGFSSIIAEH